jgi:hypothetical protein
MNFGRSALEKGLTSLFQDLRRLQWLLKKKSITRDTGDGFLILIVLITV